MIVHYQRSRSAGPVGLLLLFALVAGALLSSAALGAGLDELNYREVVIKGRRASRPVPIRLESIDAKVTLTENFADTTLTFVFANPGDQIIDGEMIFPVRPGVTFSRFEMDVEGKFRDGVIVEKNLGRSVFDRLVRYRIDPGLLEWIDGDRFRVSVFPIPAKGTKTVIIGYEEELLLGRNPSKSEYILPLRFPKKVENFDLSVTVIGSEAPKVNYGDRFSDLQFVSDPEGDSLTARISYSNYRPDRSLELGFPAIKQEVVAVTSRISASDETCFFVKYEQERSPIRKPLPERVGILWDTSGSSWNRSIPKELALLDGYFAAIRSTTVSLVRFGLESSPPEEFQVADGQWDELRRALLAVPFDGATRLHLLKPTSFHCDELLLFSDGFSTLGRSAFETGDAPIHSIVFGSRATNDSFLKRVARQTGGVFIDLAATLPDVAAKRLLEKRYRFLGVEDAEKFRELYPINGGNSASGSVAGFAPPDAEKVVLRFGYDEDSSEPVEVTLGEPSLVSAKIPGLARGLWLRKKVSDLRGTLGAEEAVAEAGMNHGLVTPYTSFIVLDRLEDYVRNRIEPPASEPDLLAAYRSRQPGNEVRTTLRAQRKSNIRATLNRRKQWYSQDHISLDETNYLLASNGVTFLFDRLRRGPRDLLVNRDLKTTQELLNRAIGLKAGRPAEAAVNSAEYRQWMKDSLELQAAIEPLKKRYGEDSRKFFEKQKKISEARKQFVEELNAQWENRNRSRGALADPFAAPAFGGGGAGGTGAAAPGSPDLPENPEEADPGAIQIVEWQPDAPYLRGFAALQTERECEAHYFELRKRHRYNPLFYVDVGDLFVSRGYRSSGVRILSNVPELRFNDVRLLRMAGYRLRALGEIEVAIDVFEEVLRLNDDTPQSWRDLGLACADAGQFQRAVKFLWEAASRPWGTFYGNISLVALSDLSVLIETHGAGLDLSGIDRSMIGVMPLDLRVTVTWDSSDTDVDLWVVDPANSMATHEDPGTITGGLLTGDVTGGFGPEEFVVHKAHPGEYSIRVIFQNHGRQSANAPTTVYVEVTENFGRPEAKTRKVYRRLRPADGLVEVATFRPTAEGFGK